jgi:hypothetical protein
MWPMLYLHFVIAVGTGTWGIAAVIIAVGTGTWGIAAVIPKYLSLRLPRAHKGLPPLRGRKHR